MKPTDELTRAADTVLANIPKHDAGLTIERHPRRAYYQTVAAWLATMERNEEPLWPSEEARQRAIDADDVWTMQWYPDTPIGSCCVAAPTLAELLAFATRAN